MRFCLFGFFLLYFELHSVDDSQWKDDDDNNDRKKRRKKNKSTVAHLPHGTERRFFFFIHSNDYFVSLTRQLFVPLFQNHFRQ